MRRRDVSRKVATSCGATVPRRSVSRVTSSTDATDPYVPTTISMTAGIDMKR